MIVSMKRMTLVAHKADEAKILNALQAIRAVEVISGGEDNGALAALERAQARLQKLGDALKTMHWPASARQVTRGQPWLVKTF